MHLFLYTRLVAKYSWPDAVDFFWFGPPSKVFHFHHDPINRLLTTTAHWPTTRTSRMALGQSRPTVLGTPPHTANTGIFSWERPRIQLSGCYLGRASTGAWSAEFVEGGRKSGKDGRLEEFFPGKLSGVPLATKTSHLMSIPGCWKRRSRKKARAEDAQRHSVTRTSY
ncbi:hypothetical protein DL771_007064 [Monosporascus sp. 5C6A]|nr:hypothetical protein DL771_007064 [Monosporascus sp. 5C6A]